MVTSMAKVPLVFFAYRSIIYQHEPAGGVGLVTQMLKLPSVPERAHARM